MKRLREFKASSVSWEEAKKWLQEGNCEVCNKIVAIAERLDERVIYNEDNEHFVGLYYGYKSKHLNNND